MRDTFVRLRSTPCLRVEPVTSVVSVPRRTRPTHSAYPTQPLHLTYCTNIHAADGWEAVCANLRRYAPALKARFSPAAPFGVGLRLSAREARELLEADRLREFRAFLDREGLYVAIINGFPYGPFHGTPVKAKVYAPDWRDRRRVDYTLDLVRILQRAACPRGSTAASRRRRCRTSPG